MRRVAVLSAVVLMVSACTEEPAEPAPRLTATDVSSLRVTGQQEQIPMVSAWLSSDGGTLLYFSSDDGVCVRGVGGSNQHCFERRAGEFDIGSAAWSSDGGRLAITETHVFGLEPDIWVLDVSSGELTDRTDDGVVQEGLSLSGDGDLPDGAVVDVFPSWHPEGDTVRFLRQKSDTTMAVTRVPAGGGEVTELGTIDANWKDLRAVAWTGARIAWATESNGGEVWVADLVGGDPRKVLDGEYSTLSFSSDGDFLLADQRDADGYAAVGKARVVPARGGDAVPVASGDVMLPTWAPEGHALAYVEKPGTLRVVGKPGDTPRTLHEQSGLTAANLDGLDWVEGAILVRVGEDRPVVLRIDG